MRDQTMKTMLWMSAVLFAAGGARAQGTTLTASDAAPEAPKTFEYNVPGLLRVSAERFGDLRVDANARLYGQNQAIAHRLAVSPWVKLFGQLTVKSELQLGTGYLAADVPDERFASFGPPRADVDAFGQDQLALRKLFVDWRSPVGTLMVGRMASNWGLGVLTNGGDDEMQDWGSPRLGEDLNYGDVVNRALFATAPIAMATDAAWAKKVILAVGADVVERDERTERQAGDDAYQVVGALRYQDQPHEAGVYVAYRSLDDRNGDTLDVVAYSLMGKSTVRRGPLELTGAGELALVMGDTTLARNNAYTGKIDVQQLGYVARAGAMYLPWGVGGDLELGYASGDSNPNDGSLRSFTFDPDYNPSLILFEQLRAAETVAAQANASDPERVGIPPTAARQLPSRGSVSNAIYVRPTVRYRWEDLAARVAIMWARAEEPVVDPYNANINGGVGVNYQGGDANEKALGVELDAGVDYTMHFDRWADVSLGVQAGHLFPGKAFADASGETHPGVSLFFGKVVVKWLPDPTPPPTNTEETATDAPVVAPAEQAGVAPAGTETPTPGSEAPATPATEGSAQP